VVVERGGREVGTWAVDDTDADLALVGALARLELRARRARAAVRLHDVSPRLRDLLRLAGLDGVLAVADDA
jgi:hypothetical protein